MFKKIVFATDGSQACKIAAKAAFELSRKYASQLTLLNVDTDISQEISPFVQDILAKEKRFSEPDYMAMVKKGMEKCYSTFAKTTGDPEYKIIQGKPIEEIPKFAQTNKADCIILGVHPQNKAERTKTLQHILQKSHCPVMTIARPCKTCFWYFNRIIFGTDFSKASMAAFYFAYKLAEFIGGRLHIFHALEIELSGTLPVPGQEQIEDAIRQAREKIKTLYISQMENFDNYDMDVREGIASIELLKFARETGGDLIVMAAKTKDSNPVTPLFGQTAGQVILRSACPVISINQSI